MDKNAKSLRLTKVACVFTLIAALVSAGVAVVSAVYSWPALGPAIMAVCMLLLFGCMLWMYKTQKKAAAEQKKR